jgi:hypothetical protein
MCQSEYTVELRETKQKHLHCKSFSSPRVVVLPFLMHCPPVVLEEIVKERNGREERGGLA